VLEKVKKDRLKNMIEDSISTAITKRGK